MPLIETYIAGWTVLEGCWFQIPLCSCDKVTMPLRTDGQKAHSLTPQRAYTHAGTSYPKSYCHSGRSGGPPHLFTNFMLIKVDFFNIYGVYALGKEVPKLVYAFLMCKPVLHVIGTIIRWGQELILWRRFDTSAFAHSANLDEDETVQGNANL